jgi:aminoglycoside N3'-acetyltransferase
MTSTGKIEITKSRLLNDLKKIGVAKGDHLAVTLSFKSIGQVIGGPEAFIDTLLEAVGPEGTIMMNTYTRSFGSAVIPSDFIYDSATTMPYTGLVPRVLIKRKDAIRSLHPTGSVASIGKMAKYLTENHDGTANPFLPYEKLAEISGKYLAIGIGDRLVGIRHEAQKRAGLFVVPMYGGVKFKSSDGKIKVFIGISSPCTKKLPELVPKLEKMGIIKRGNIGLAHSLIAPADKILDTMTDMLKKDPTLNLCDDWRCHKCRELERRMNLYEKITNPKLFQRNSAIRAILSWINRLIIWKLQYYDWRKKRIIIL